MKLTALDSTDLELLIILQEKPTANDSTLARLTGLSSPTIKRRIDRLSELKAVERIQALLDYESLELNIVCCFLEITYSNIDQVTKVLEESSFIYYQVRCFGHLNGIHATFRIPKNKLSQLHSQISKLKEDGLVINFEVIEQSEKSEEIRSKPRFIVYNSKENKWDWNFKKWGIISHEKLFKPLSEPELDNIYYSEYDKPGLAELDLIDIEILSILSLNSRIKNVEILKILSSQVSPQRLSDRLRFLKKYYITNYRVYLNWEHIFHFLGFVFYCICTEEIKKYFRILLRFRPPPFETTFREHKKGFILYAICPSNHMLDLIQVLDNKVSKFFLYFLDYNTSKRYKLQPKIFNPETKTWLN